MTCKELIKVLKQLPADLETSIAIGDFHGSITGVSTDMNEAGETKCVIKTDQKAATQFPEWMKAQAAAQMASQALMMYYASKQ